MGALHSLPAGPVIVGLPIASVTARGKLPADWFMLRYRVASDWVEVFCMSKADVYALRSVVQDAFKCLGDVYELSSDGSVFMLEDYHDEAS